MANFDNLINDNQHVNTIGDNPAPVVQETYTDDEIRDVNNITVAIPDTKLLLSYSLDLLHLVRLYHY